MKEVRVIRMEKLDSEEDSDEDAAQVPQRAKTIIVVSALIMIVGSVFLLVLIAAFAGSSINPSCG